MICALRYSNIVIKDHRAEVTTMGGVIYEVLTPMSDFTWCSDDCSPTGGHFQRLEIYHHINEQGQALYGFETVEARNVFIDLITEVEGMGCAKALKVMSYAEPEKLVVDIANGNLEALTSMKGIGPKSAERIITTLKDKYASFSTKKDLGSITTSHIVSTGHTQVSEEMRVKFQDTRKTAELALIELGYGKRRAAAVLDALDWPVFFNLKNISLFDNQLDLNNVLQLVIKESIRKLQTGA